MEMRYFAPPALKLKPTYYFKKHFYAGKQRIKNLWKRVPPGEELALIMGESIKGEGEESDRHR